MTVHMRLSVRPNRWGMFEKRAAKAFERAIALAVREARRTSLRKIREISAKQIGSYTGGFQRGWTTRRSGKRGFILYNRAKHARFVEAGRRPGGRMPPVDAIRQWARSKGKAKLAFAIARSIAKKGIKARPVLSSRSVQRMLWRLFDRILQKRIDDAIRQAGHGL